MFSHYTRLPKFTLLSAVDMYSIIHAKSCHCPNENPDFREGLPIAFGCYISADCGWAQRDMQKWNKYDLTIGPRKASWNNMKLPLGKNLIYHSIANIRFYRAILSTQVTKLGKYSVYQHV